MIIMKLIVFWLIFFWVTYTTYFIYNIRMWHPETWSYLDTYPFKCFKCATTWSLVTIYIMVGIIMSDTVFTLFGIMLASLYGYGLHKNEKERFQ